MSESRRKLAEELYKHRNDPGEWNEEAEEIEVKPRRSSVLSFRLPPEELDALERNMERTGETLSEYIRKALALRLHRANFAEPMPGIISGSFGVATEEEGRRTATVGIREGSYGRATTLRKERIPALSGRD